MSYLYSLIPGSIYSWPIRFLQISLALTNQISSFILIHLLCYLFSLFFHYKGQGWLLHQSSFCFSLSCTLTMRFFPWVLFPYFGQDLPQPNMVVVGTLLSIDSCINHCQFFPQHITIIHLAFKVVLHLFHLVGLLNE